MVIPKINSAHGPDTRNVINAAIDAINFQGKTIQDLVAKGQLTPSQYATLIQTVNGMVKSGHVDKSDLTPEFKGEIEGFNTQLAQKVQKGGNEQVSWGMLDQTTKENITGGNTPVVGVNSVNTSNIVDGAVTRTKAPDGVWDRSKLSTNFMYSGRIENDVPIDTLFNDGTYIITAGNPGTFPDGEVNQSGWVLEIKTIDRYWTYQTLIRRTDPSIQYVRLIRNSTNEVNPWRKIRIGSENDHSDPLDPLKPFKMLIVGNSYGLNAMQYLHHISASAGIDITVGLLYRDGERLSVHYENAINDNKNYTYYKYTATDGSVASNTSSNYSINDGVLDEEWDLITFHQRSGLSDDYSTYQPYLNDLRDHIKASATNVRVEFGVHQTWAYATSRREDQMVMYNGLVDAYQKAMNDADIGVLIPNGTAIQSGRMNSYLMSVDNELTSDGSHLSDLGSYIAGLTMFESLLSGRYKKDIYSDVSYIAPGVSKYHAYLSKVIAKNAVLSPFKVTDI